MKRGERGERSGKEERGDERAERSGKERRGPGLGRVNIHVKSISK